MKISLESSTTTTTGPQATQSITNIVAGQIFSCRCVAKVDSPNVAALLRIAWYSGSVFGGFIGDTTVARTTNTEDTVLQVENAVIPAEATRCVIMLRIVATTAGNTGTAWFKSPELIRHSTFKRPDKSAWLYGPKWVPDGLEFDGVDDYCVVENNADADITVATRERPLTISVVARPTGDVQSYLLAKNNDANTNQYGILYSPSAPSRLRFRTNDLGDMYSLGVPVVANEILFYVVTYDGVSLGEYKNGRLVSTTNVSGTLTSRNHIHIGCRKSTSAREYHYKGTISELYIGHAQPDELMSWFERTGRFEKYGIK